MPDRLPPLTALRAFEAAARHMSFAKAADELYVTPAALSYQIKSLEEHLGTPVFRRLNRAVELTEVGKALAPGISNAFQILASSWQAAHRTQDGTSLTVTAGPAFTAKWLAPRLYDFALAHPDIELRFSASLKMVDLGRDGVDVAIRFGYGPDKDLYSLPLAEEWVSPVMTPELAARYPTVESLTRAPVIFDDSIQFLNPPADWETWFSLYGIHHTPTHGPRFSQADHALDAALAGGGVVLGRRALVVKDILDGRLVAPFTRALGTGARFRFICQEEAAERPQIVAFRDWILAEIEKGQPVTDAMDVVPVAAR